MNIREKLMELLLNSLHYTFDEDICAATFDAKTTAEKLIANGVTVQEWIPVTERLPQERVEVLVYHKNGYISLNSITPCLGYRWRYVDDRNAITHWMQLPAPPKGGGIKMDLDGDNG